MQTERKQRIITEEDTDKSLVTEKIYRQVDELGEGWRLATVTTTTETVTSKPMIGKPYKRYTMTAVVERQEA
ncbi:MAG: hypothetical protein WC551_07130 [Patescibacteria group bacterium]